MVFELPSCGMAAKPKPVGVRSAHLTSGRLREVVDQSARLFDQDGYNRVSMQDIAAAVGIRKPTLYHYVKSKDELLVHIHREFMHLALSNLASPKRAELQPSQQLIEIMADILGLMDTHPGYVRVFFEHYRELPPAAKRSIKRDRDRYETIVQSILRQGVKEGTFRQVNIPLATLAVFGMCNWAYQWYDREGELSSRQIAEAFADYLLNGLSA